MKTPQLPDRVCEQCGLIHLNGIERHGRCYKCGGDLILWNKEDHEMTAVTPGGLQIFEKKPIK